MKTILFQGDSITDCARSRENTDDLGTGYAKLVADEMNEKYPDKYKFYNRGVSGDRIVDIYARIKADIINLAPDYMSILVGVNDVWHELKYSNGVDAKKYEKIYTMLLEEIYEALPDIRIFMFAPYFMRGSCTESTEQEPDRWGYFKRELALRAEAAKRVAEKFGIPFVTLQDKFEKVANELGDDKPLTVDGVHPAQKGHELIRDAWLEAFSKIEE